MENARGDLDSHRVGAPAKHRSVVEFGVWRIADRRLPASVFHMTLRDEYTATGGEECEGDESKRDGSWKLHEWERLREADGSKNRMTGGKK